MSDLVRGGLGYFLPRYEFCLQVETSQRQRPSQGRTCVNLLRFTNIARFIFLDSCHLKWEWDFSRGAHSQISRLFRLLSLRRFAPRSMIGVGFCLQQKDLDTPGNDEFVLKSKRQGNWQKEQTKESRNLETSRLASFGGWNAEAGDFPRVCQGLECLLLNKTVLKQKQDSEASGMFLAVWV